MNFYELLQLLQIIVWPVVAIVAIAVVRPYLQTLLSGAKIKLIFRGLSMETTLPEIRQIFEEQGGDALSAEQIEYLKSLLRGARQYPPGIDKSEERKFLRPLRNAGLILAIPRNAFLSETTAMEISALGRLFLRAYEASSKSGT